MVVVTVLDMRAEQLFDNTIGACCWQIVVVTVLGLHAVNPTLQTVLGVTRWLPPFNKGDGVGHMFTVVGLYTVAVQVRSSVEGHPVEHNE